MSSSLLDMTQVHSGMDPQGEGYKIQEQMEVW